MSQPEVRPGLRGRQSSSASLHDGQGLSKSRNTGGTAGQGIKGKSSAVQAHVKRGMFRRTALAKVWEERMEEDQPLEERQAVEQVEPTVQSVSISGGGTTGRMQTSEEIGVFDAERYFRGGAEQQEAGWQGLREELEQVGDGASGDLPLSPLVEFGKAGKQRLPTGSSSGKLGRQQQQWAAGAGAAVTLERRCVESTDQFSSPSTSNTSSLSELDPPLINMQQRPRPHAPAYGTDYKQPSKKPQPASPNSSRLASFLAKFKPAVSHNKSPAANSDSIIHQHVKSATPPPPRTSSSTRSPHGKFLPHALFSAGSISGKPSPRGRLLHAFSSTASGENPISGTSLRHYGASAVVVPSNIATSSPVSPAARSAPDPYSPVAKSASTTPTSGRIPRSVASLPSSQYCYDGKMSSLKKQGGTTRHSPRSFKQLPFLSRKLKVYLMPEKSTPVTKHDSNLTSKSKVPENGVRPNSERDHGDLFSLHHPRKQAVNERQRRTRWLYAEDQAVDEDIVLAERLLRVVQDHQASHLNPAAATMSDRNLYCQPAGLNSNGLKFNYNISRHVINKSTAINGGHGDRVSEYSSRKYDQMHPTRAAAGGGISHHHHNVQTNLVASSYCNSPGGSSDPCGTKVDSSNVSSRHAAAGLGLGSNAMVRQAAGTGKTSSYCVKEESSVYDSDSSSDLFELETLASVGGTLSHRGRDLPVYEAKSSSPAHHQYNTDRFGCNYNVLPAANRQSR